MKAASGPLGSLAAHGGVAGAAVLTAAALADQASASAPALISSPVV